MNRPSTPASSVAEEGYSFSESLNIEDAANSIVVPLLRSRLGDKFRKAYHSEQMKGKDFIVHNRHGVVSFELKAEAYPENVFAEFAQLVQDTRKIDFGNIQKTEATYYLLANFPGQYAVLVHRETWAHLLVRFAMDDIFYGRQGMRAVPNQNRKTGSLSRCAYGMPFSIRELLAEYLETGQPCGVFDISTFGTQEEFARVVADARQLKGESDWKGSYVQGLMRAGRQDREALITQLKKTGRALEPLSMLAALVSDLQRDTESMRVRSGGPFFLKHATSASRTQKPSRIAGEIQGSYAAASTAVAEYFGASSAEFFAPGCDQGKAW